MDERTYHQKYYDKNRDQLLKNKRDYYDEYRVEILSYQKKLRQQSEIITCKCGRKVKEHCLSQHLKTNIHKKNLLLKLHDAKKENL